MKKHYLYLGIGLMVMSYVVLRALGVDITYDEAWTLKVFVPKNVLHIINFTPCDANNHMVNTLLIKLFHPVFGDSLFVSRLPNVLACVAFLYFLSQISMRFFSHWIGLCLFVALCANPFMLDFFGLARGYGLAMTFMMCSLYHLLSFLDTYQTRHGHLTLILASLAVLSNFPLINYWLGVFFVIHFAYFFNQVNKQRFYRMLETNIWITLALFAVMYEPVRKLIRYKKLYYGGKEGFYADTLQSLTAHTLYNPQDVEGATLALNLCLISLLILLICSLLARFRIRNMLSDKRFLLMLLLTIPILSNVCQFHLLGTRFLIDRTALFYYPLILMVGFYWVQGIGKSLYAKFSKAVVLFLTCALVWNLTRHANLHKTVIWDHDSRTTAILSYLDQVGRKAQRKIRLDSVWPFQSTIRHYMRKQGYPHVDYVKKRRKEIKEGIDFFLYYDKPLRRVRYHPKWHRVHQYEKDTVLQYPSEGIYLFRLIRKIKE